MIIGLTGGIASGKSTVAKVFENMGITVIDADKVAKDIIAEDKNKEMIVQLFGDEILDGEDKIIFKIFRKKVFESDDLREKLNSLIHPQVIEKYKNIGENLKEGQIVVYDIPLLFETHMENLCDKVIVVGINRTKQIKRLMKRDRITEKLANKMIDSQMPQDEKIEKANYVIMNNGSIEDLEENARKVLETIVQEVKR